MKAISKEHIWKLMHGVQLFVIVRQEHMHCYLKQKLKTHKSLIQFVLEMDVFFFSKTFQLILQREMFSPFIQKIEIVRSDVFSLDLDALRNYKLVALNVEIKVFNKGLGWSMKIKRKEGQMYLTGEYDSILFSKLELESFHYLVFHPSPPRCIILYAVPI